MDNRICHKCDGRGFAWELGGIKSRVTHEIIATTHKQGARCSDCLGSGVRNYRPETRMEELSRHIAYVAIAVVVLFIFIPALIR